MKKQAKRQMKKQKKIKEPKTWDKTQKPKAPKLNPKWYKETVLFKTSKANVLLSDILKNIPSNVETSDINIKYNTIGNYYKTYYTLQMFAKTIIDPEQIKEHTKKLKIYKDQLKQHNEWLTQQEIKKLEEKLSKLKE